MFILENNKTSRYWASLQRSNKIMLIQSFVEMFKIFFGNHLLERKKKFSA
jgi:hypothetical protein